MTKRHKAYRFDAIFILGVGILTNIIPYLPQIPNDEVLSIFAAFAVERIYHFGKQLYTGDIPKYARYYACLGLGASIWIAAYLCWLFFFI